MELPSYYRATPVLQRGILRRQFPTLMLMLREAHQTRRRGVRSQTAASELAGTVDFLATTSSVAIGTAAFANSSPTKAATGLAGLGAGAASHKLIRKVAGLTVWSEAAKQASADMLLNALSFMGIISGMVRDFGLNPQIASTAVKMFCVGARHILLAELEELRAVLLGIAASFRDRRDLTLQHAQSVQALFPERAVAARFCQSAVQIFPDVRLNPDFGFVEGFKERLVSILGGIPEDRVPPALTAGCVSSFLVAAFCLELQPPLSKGAVLVSITMFVLFGFLSCRLWNAKCKENAFFDARSMAMQKLAADIEQNLDLSVWTKHLDDLSPHVPDLRPVLPQAAQE